MFVNLYLWQIEVRRHFVKTCHLRAVRKFLEDPQSKWQTLLDLGALFAEFQLLQLLNVLVQLEIIQDYGDEKTQYDLKR